VAVLVDTNAFFPIFRGNTTLTHQVAQLGPYINTVIWVELIQGSKSNADIKKSKREIAPIPIIHFDHSISTRAMQLIEQYSIFKF